MIDREKHIAALTACIAHAGDVADDLWERFCRADTYLTELTLAREDVPNED